MNNMQSNTLANQNSKLFHKARENLHKQVTIVLVLHLIGWESGASFLNQSLCVVIQNHSKRKLLSTLKWKPL